MAVEVGPDAVEVVGDERAAGTPGILLVDVVAEAEHEVVDEQLRTAGEEVGQRLGSLFGLELVLLLDRDPGQLASLPGEFVARSHVLLLGSDQLAAGRMPFLMGSSLVLRHRLLLVLRLVVTYIVSKM